jgi:short subunit dehydrogenase-like uncharacterized protein
MVQAGRPYDVVLYGATGFVGRQTAEYFARVGAGVRWAIAGRSGAKLEEIRRSLGNASVGVLVADAADAHAQNEMAASCRVVLSTAGPFARYGSELVAACVKQRTHYVDITGETPWVRGVMDRHHAQAAADGTRIIPFCGFDSVPSDLGSWLVVQAIRNQFGEDCASIKAAFTVKGGLNGGTLASVVNLIESGQRSVLSQPFLLNPANVQPADASSHTDPIGAHYDGDFSAWLGPFFMGPVNTRVVRRSAALSSPAAGYGSDFHYQEYMRFGRGPLGAVGAAGASLAGLAFQAAFLFPPVRHLVTAVAPPPGQGPSTSTMDSGFFRCDLVGVSSTGRTMRGRVSDSGDPGNRATTKFVCEAALALAQNFDELPGGSTMGGVLTPAIGLGEPYARRLRAAGMTLEVSAKG